MATERVQIKIVLTTTWLIQNQQIIIVYVPNWSLLLIFGVSPKVVQIVPWAYIYTYM